MSGEKHTAELWGVAIAGPDDLFAMPDYRSAVIAAHQFNTWWIAEALPVLTENHPRMWATPVPWPWRDETYSHSRDLANASSEYGAFRQASISKATAGSQ